MKYTLFYLRFQILLVLTNEINDLSRYSTYLFNLQNIDNIIIDLKLKKIIV